MNYFKQCLPSDTKTQVKSWIKKAVKEASKLGLTGVHDAWQDAKTVEVIKELIEEGEFPIRCYGMLASNDSSLLAEYFSNGHYFNKYLTIRSVKAFIDGAFGSRGAALHDPYCDDVNNCGLILISQEEFNQLARDCFDNDFQLNTHAIGDRGNTYVLNCYGQQVKQNNNKRWRIEHAQMVSDEDLYKFKEYDILPSMQPSHCTSDMPWLDDRIGKYRLPLISRWQSFINLGLKIPGGSDCPIETGNPLFEFYAAVTRQNHSGLPEQGWQPQEKVSKLNALKMFTSWAAYGAFDEYRRGKIAVGYDADLTILSNNLLEIDASEVLNTQILGTIVNGKIIYSTLI
jgi:predicted amidohydrolase YtcJ